MSSGCPSDLEPHGRLSGTGTFLLTHGSRRWPPFSFLLVPSFSFLSISLLFFSVSSFFFLLHFLILAYPLPSTSLVSFLVFLPFVSPFFLISPLRLLIVFLDAVLSSDYPSPLPLVSYLLSLYLISSPSCVSLSHRVSHWPYTLSRGVASFSPTFALCSCSHLPLASHCVSLSVRLL